MDKKLTIKELAGELNVDHPTMLREIKHHLNIQLKSSTTAVDEEDATKIRAYYKDKNTVTSSVATEDGGVILRRRRSVEPKDSDNNFVEEQQVETPADSAKQSASPESVDSEKPKKEAKTKATKAQDKEVKLAEKTAKLADKEAKNKTSKSQDKDKEAKLAEKEAKLAAKKEKEEKIKQSTARIIRPAQSTPEVVAEVPAAQEVQPAAVVEPHAQTQNVPAQNVEEVVAEPSVQETVQKASEATVQETPITENAAKPQNEKKSNASISAKPDGTSTKSILPPAGERSFANDYSRQPVSQVRVISKPDPEKRQAEAQARESRENRDNRDNRDNRQPRQNRDGRDNRDNRDNRQPRDGRFPPRQNRPDGQGQGQAQGGRPPFEKKDFSKDKDGDQRNARPQRPQQTPRPRPSLPEGVPFMAEEQSRKKRNKNKKGNEFSENTQQQDFKFNKFTYDADGDDAPRRRKPRKKEQKVTQTTTAPMKAAKRKLRIEETIRVADMAHQMGLKSSEIIKVLFGLGVMATINSSLDFDTAGVVAAEFEYEVEKVGFSAEEAILPTTPDTPEQLKLRPPVVTIMGHVDHGKTSLLDAIRETNVTAGEAGGITQHIGAYHVKTQRGEIVFLDTPGHEAFTAMRLRGAQVTDIVVLVVAADDGVMEQTREAINHAKAAEVPIIVAVNKMDKEGANPDRVLRELAELGLQAEDWGGDTVTTMLSAKKREGIDELLELLILQSEIMELKANPDKHARGHIVEAKLDKGRGPVATVLIQEGTLHQGDAFVCGVFAGRVRALFNDQGKKIQSAGPSMPVEVQGFEGVPEAGEEFVSLQDEKMARRIADTRAIKQREKVLAKESRVTLETFLSRKADTAEAMVLNLILKADVQGSLEAITEALNKLSTEKVRINVLHGGAGSISESDIMLAAASEAIIIGFNVRPTAKVKEVADNENVDIRYYDIIYKLVEEIRAAMAGLLAPVQKEVYLGQAEVRETFSLSRVGTIAGTYVVDGRMARNAGVRLLREGVVIYTGKISSLKRFKDDAKEVMKGFECGISLENFNDIKVGDIFETFEMKEEAAEL